MTIEKNIYNLLFLSILFGLNIQAACSASKPDTGTTQSLASTRFVDIDKKIKKLNPKASIQLGGFIAHNGQAQNIKIEGLIGDHFSVAKHTDSNGLFGAGFYIDGIDANQFNLSYGINAFYLAKTGVTGLVTQEQLFTNLSYHYTVTNYPVYFAAKAHIKNETSNKYHLTLDAGIGPNIMTTSNVNETSIDSITLPDQTYAGRTTTKLSATAGIGVQINNVIGKTPIECGYRFFYLGQGSFNKINDQLISRFETGNSYANALLCTLTI